MTDNILEAIQKLQDESLGNYTRANKAEQELRAARDLIARLESEVGQYQALEAGLRRRVEAGKEIMTPTKPDWADKEAARLWRWLSGWSQRDLAATLRSSYARGKREVLDELYAVLAATEPPQPPPARDPDMLGSAGRYQTTDPSYSGELTAGGSTGDGERACVDGASDAQHAPKRPTPAVATEADRIGGATAAPEPPAEPVACEQRVDAPGPPIVCECCQLSTDLYATPQNLGTAPDELLAWVCRTCVKRLGIHIVAAVVRDRRSVSTITTLRAELEQLQDNIEQELGWPDVTSEDRRDYFRAISDAKLRITVAEEQQEQLRAELEQAMSDLTQAECARDDLQKKRDRLADGMREKNGYIARLDRELRDTKSERDQYKSAIARLRAKVGPVVEWWRSYNPVLVDLRGIVPVLARRLDVLKAGWED